MVLPVPFLLQAFAAAVAATPRPTVFWNSKGQLPNTTVLALGDGLAGVSVTVCQDATHTTACAPAAVLQSSRASVHFVLPVVSAPLAQAGAAAGVGAASALWFRACGGGVRTQPQLQPGPEAVDAQCSGWRAVNSVDVWWAQGDQSRGAAAAASAGGWLKVYGRAVGLAGSGYCAPGNTTAAGPAASGVTIATLTHHDSLLQTGGKGQKLQIAASAASCYDATFAIPAAAAPGAYSLSIARGAPWLTLGTGHHRTAVPLFNASVNPTFWSREGFFTQGVRVRPPRSIANGLPGAAASTTHEQTALTLTVVAADPWPRKKFPVALGSEPWPGKNIAAALAAAAAAGGGVVVVGAGTHEMGNSSLELGDNVQLVGDGRALLRWGQPTTRPLIANANASTTASRYAVRDLTIAVEAAATGFVLDMGGHGVEISGVTVTMPHTLSGAASVVHAHGTGFSVSGCNMTHDQLTCTNPGYPRDCLLHFVSRGLAGCRSAVCISVHVYTQEHVETATKNTHALPTRALGGSPPARPPTLC